MDNINKNNRERWNALARANVEYTRPFLDFTIEDAQRYIYRHTMLKDVRGKRVLCLAAGGGQDSVAFALLGADVTVFDLSDVQLERDRLGAAHHNLKVTAIHGDMRDLKVFPAKQFDIVWQPYSINFVPEVDSVICGVARILKPGGIYYLQFANPFVQIVDDEAWDGNAYPLNGQYLDGEDLSVYFPHWDVDQPDSTHRQLESPHEFRHTLGTIMNTLVQYNFIFLGLWEWMKPDADPEPGSWAHFTQTAPPWFDSFWRLAEN
ncbi:MAG: class I SAM-dependent methyltransferase [Anaerolineae bacterium]|nr:class I SAM-dependent methyltransferase [Anaerolineae bacterium]